MVYRSPEVRHPTTPLRLSPQEIAQVVDSEGLRCTHFDAFRFFTPSATPLNRIQLTRQNTDEHDQKGCLHVAMDLYKYAYKLAPWSSGELIADAFLLACKARQIDMRAQPLRPAIVRARTDSNRDARGAGRVCRIAAGIIAESGADSGAVDWGVSGSVGEQTGRTSD